MADMMVVRGQGGRHVEPRAKSSRGESVKEERVSRRNERLIGGISQRKLSSILTPIALITAMAADNHGTEPPPPEKIGYVECPTTA
jgi:hypothetical protein